MAVDQYMQLIEAYLANEISAEEFAVRYQAMIRSSDWMDWKLFKILQDLFEDAEAYSPMWTAEDESPFQITEPTFRREVEDAKEELARYMER
jgi:hypothetical protein